MGTRAPTLRLHHDEEQSAYVESPAGLLVPGHAAEAIWPRKPVCIDLFAGCGGMSLGMKQAGWDVAAAVEWDCSASETYMANLCRYGEFGIHFIEEADRDRFEQYLQKRYRKAEKKKGKRIEEASTAGCGWISDEACTISGTRHFVMGDVRKLTGERLLAIIGMERGEVDAIVGGPPCQGFSNAGKRNVMDPRNSLVFDFARLIVEVQPKTMVMENVPGIVSMVTPEGVPVIDAMARILQDGDFMTMDAFRKTLTAQHGAVGFLKTKKRDKAAEKKEQSEVADEMQENGDQSDLFSGVAA